MLLIYASITGNVENFIERVGLNAIELNTFNPFFTPQEEYIVITPSYEDESIVFNPIKDFIEYKDNRKKLVGFIGSGNVNFDNDYCITAKKLSEHFKSPLIHTFEFNGTEHDIEFIKREVERYAISPIN